MSSLCPEPETPCAPATGTHLQWLLRALRAGAARHDAFEVQRHVAVGPKEAVALGGALHDIANGDDALSSVTGLGVSVSYRSVSGDHRTLTLELDGNGRLGVPRFR